MVIPTVKKNSRETSQTGHNLAKPVTKNSMRNSPNKSPSLCSTSIITAEMINKCPCGIVITSTPCNQPAQNNNASLATTYHSCNGCHLLSSTCSFDPRKSNCSTSFNHNCDLFKKQNTNKSNKLTVKSPVGNTKTAAKSPLGAKPKVGTVAPTKKVSESMTNVRKPIDTKVKPKIVLSKQTATKKVENSKASVANGKKKSVPASGASQSNPLKRKAPNRSPTPKDNASRTPTDNSKAEKETEKSNKKHNSENIKSYTKREQIKVIRITTVFRNVRKSPKTNQSDHNITDTDEDTLCEDSDSSLYTEQLFK